MAIWYTDIAANQKANINYPGVSGAATMTTQPGTQNPAVLEGPPEIIATYTWVGTEAANDIINIAVLQPGWVVDTSGRVCSGTTAPAVTLTVAIGDNDLALPTARPIPNPQSILAQPAGYQAPKWVSGTSYVAGNVVYDTASTPANQVFTCISAVSGSTAPSSDATHWIPNQQRYSNSIDVHAASGNVAFAGGTQMYGGPALAPTTGTVSTTDPGNYTAAQAANSQYQIQTSCWLQALVLTANTPAANTVSVFRVPVVAAN